VITPVQVLILVLGPMLYMKVSDPAFKRASALLQQRCRRHAATPPRPVRMRLCPLIVWFGGR
jgi:hypothetical protein